MSSEYYGRGCINPYQYFLHDDGQIIENRFGEVSVVGNISMGEVQKIKENVTTSFSIRSISPISLLVGRQSDKTDRFIKALEERIDSFTEQYISSELDFLWQRTMFNDMMYGWDDPLNIVRVRRKDKSDIIYNFDIDYLIKEYKEKEHERHIIQISSRLNKNKRAYYYEHALNSYINRRYISLDVDDSLDAFIYQNKYSALKIETGVPEIKLNIKLKGDPYGKYTR